MRQNRQTKNIVISGTNFWNPGDDFVRDGVIRILNNIFPACTLNFLFYNFNQDFFPQDKFSGIHNMLSEGDLDQYKDHIDAVVIAGLSAGSEIKDLYNWVLKNNLEDRVFLIGAGYENDYAAVHIQEEPERTIFQKAKIITGRTKKVPKLITDLNLPYHHINCPAILSVENVKEITPQQKLEKIAFSIQLPHGTGIPNHSCSREMYLLAINIFSELFNDYKLSIIAHHKSEYFHFLKLMDQYGLDTEVIFSSFYQDLHKIYPKFDLIITTRLHASLFANGFGIPGIILNDTDRHTHCLEGFKHSFWINSKENFYKQFNLIKDASLAQISEELKVFKEDLLKKYLDVLTKPFSENLKLKENTDMKFDKLNIGCGSDYREGFLNIDGNENLKTDLVLDVVPGALPSTFNEGTISYILAKDFIEHHFHWEARKLLEDFHFILMPGGTLELILPNIANIISDSQKPIEEKRIWLYGGQDIPQAWEKDKPNSNRKNYPQYFCHKFGWTKELLLKELNEVGFELQNWEDQGWNMRVLIEKKNLSENKITAFETGVKISNDYEFDSEKNEQKLVRTLVKPGMTVFDVGAHLGKYTKLFSLLTGETGKVIAFEPTKESFTKLQSSVKELNLINVELINKAVYSKDCNVLFYQFPEKYSSWNSVGLPRMNNPEDVSKVVEIKKKEEVEAVSLDSFCRLNNVTEIDYLKVDVEGAEIFALAGAEELLRNKKVKYLQFEISQKMLEGLNTEASYVFQYLNSLGYTCHKITDEGKIGEKVYDSDSFYENYIAFPMVEEQKEQNNNELPVHFFTIVLNGKPFIDYHINVFKELPFKWHWHIVEGVAELNHDTAWSVENGGSINDQIHKNGLSKDGTSEYLDEIEKQFPNNVTLYRKDAGVFWDGKLEMVNSPLQNINEECLLWQIDFDELWTTKQIIDAREMFIKQPDKTAAFFYCDYFVGEKLVIATKNTYGNHQDYEWRRAWRYKPGDEWQSHEPPKLMRKTIEGNWIDLSEINSFTHSETEAENLIFQHYAYVTDEQLKFKEVYYGYKDAIAKWKELNSVESFPVQLKEFFPWVDDATVVEEIASRAIKPIAFNIKGKWEFDHESISNRRKPFKTAGDYNLEAEVEIVKNGFERARFLLKLTLDLERKNINAKNNLAVVEILEKNYEKAVEYLKEVLDKDQSNEIAIGNLKYLEELLKENVTN